MHTSVLDESKVGAFMERTLGDAAGMFAGTLAMLGDRLGLFRELAEGGPASASELAERAGVDERYALEWLRGLTAAGYLEAGADGRFALPPEHAQVLAAEGGPFFLGGAYELTFGYMQTIDRVIEAFRSGGGVPQSAYPPQTWEGMSRFSRPFYDHLLVQQWLPAVEGLSERLERGASWADVGCGAGLALIRLSEAFPRSKFVGYDRFEGQLELARRAAAEAGVSDRVRFELLDASAGIPERFDVVSTFDVVHDAADPDGLVASVRGALADDGIYVVLEMNSADDPAENVGPVAALLYGVSILYCMTTSLAEGGHGLGTCGLPPARLRELCERNGFGSVRRVPLDDPFHALYDVRP
ncbi:MAG TPA: methyltransferase domain-containing protein [Thermoleophilaceae bacterium]|jgi:SAM-dependent methyltransferase